MPRKMTWIEADRFWGWGCSDCAWLFNHSGDPAGNSLEEMLQNYEDQRDNEFKAHVCARHPRAKKRQN
jgi:hypothetical protein